MKFRFGAKGFGLFGCRWCQIKIVEMLYLGFRRLELVLLEI